MKIEAGLLYVDDMEDGDVCRISTAGRGITVQSPRMPERTVNLSVGDGRQVWTSGKDRAQCIRLTSLDPAKIYEIRCEKESDWQSGWIMKNVTPEWPVTPEEASGSPFLMRLIGR
jgi:hypothetical protein